MTKKKLIFFLLLTTCSLLLFSQEKNIPEFYGVYLLTNQQSIELNAQDVEYIRPRGECDKAEHIFGIKSFSVDDVNDNNCRIIIFKEDLSINDIKLTKLKYVNQLPLLCSPLIRSSKKIMTRVNMWVKEKDIEYRVGPVEGKEKMYKIVPKEPFEAGVYAINTGCFRRFMADIYSLYLEVAETGTEAYVFTVNFDKYKELNPHAKPEIKTYNKVQKKDKKATMSDLISLLEIAKEELVKSRNAYIRGELKREMTHFTNARIALEKACNLTYENVDSNTMAIVKKCKLLLLEARNIFVSGKASIKAHVRIKKAKKELDKLLREIKQK